MPEYWQIGPVKRHGVLNERGIEEPQTLVGGVPLGPLVVGACALLGSVVVGFVALLVLMVLAALVGALIGAAPLAIKVLGALVVVCFTVSWAFQKWFVSE